MAVFDILSVKLVAATAAGNLLPGNPLPGNLGLGLITAFDLSANGQKVVFDSNFPGLDPADTNGQPDIFLRDMAASTTTLVSRANGVNGIVGDGASSLPAISDDGTRVAFLTSATNFANDTNGSTDIYLRNLVTSADTQLSRRPGSDPANGGANGNLFPEGPAISGDGSLVAFVSSNRQLISANIADDPSNGSPQVFLASADGSNIRLVSRADGSNGAASAGATYASVSGDGRYVSFSANGTLTATATTGYEVYLRDVQLGNTILVSRADGANGAPADTSPLPGVGFSRSAVSADGRFVAFESTAGNLGTADGNSVSDIYLRDTLNNTTTLISRANGANGAIGDGASTKPSISADGRYVVFTSTAANLVGNDLGGVDSDVFIRDTVENTTLLVSRGLDATLNVTGTDGKISADGRHVALRTINTTDAVNPANFLDSNALILVSLGNLLQTPGITLLKDNVALLTADILAGGLTNDATPGAVISLANTGALAGDTAILLLDGNNAASKVLDAADILAGSVTLTPNVATQGVHSLVAKLTNEGGDSPLSGSFAFTLDSVAPISGLTGIIDDTGRSGTDGITKDTTLRLTGTLSEAASVVVEASADNGATWTPLGSENLPAGAFNLDFTSITAPQGSYIVRLTPTDAAGNVGTPATRTVVVDTTLPDAPALTGITDDTGTPGDRITTDHTLFFSGTTEAFGLVELFWTGTGKIGQAIANNLGVFSIDATGTTLPDGVQNFTATTTDIAGNTSLPSAAFTVTLTSLANAPTITLLRDDAALLTADILAGGLTNDATPGAVISLSNTNAVAGNTLTLLLDGGSPVARVLNAADILAGSVTLTPTVGTQGLHALTARVTNVNGDGPLSGSFAFTLDSVAPISGLTGIIDDTGRSGTDGITKDTTLRLTGTLSEAANIVVEASADAGLTWTPLGSGNLPAGAFNLDGTFFVASQGSYIVRLTPTDAAGNVGTPATLAVVVDTTMPVAPTLTAISDDTGIGTPGDRITTDHTLFFSGTTEAFGLVELFWTGTGKIGQAIANNLGAFTIDATGTFLPDGTQNFTATTTDIAGNTSLPTAAFSVQIVTPVTPPVNLNLTGIWGQSFLGTPFDDVIIIAGGDNTVDALAGNDLVQLTGWNNTILGGEGNDTIYGGQGDGWVDGGSGDDVITVDGWNNTIFGGTGNDIINAGQGNATVDAGSGNNLVIVHGWNNSVTAGAGNDTVQGSDGNSFFSLGDGNNVIQSWGYNNTVILGNGNNSVEDFDGSSNITAGNGNNTIGLHGWNNVLNLGDGTNHVIVAAGGNTTITAGNGANTIELSGWNNIVTLGNGANKVWAGMGMSVIKTGSGDDQVWIGGSGASDVSTGGGNDVIYTGGAFGDTLRGGTGNDQYVIRNASDIIIENGGEGYDVAWVEVNGYVLAANVEEGRLSGTATQLTGSAGGDILVANTLLGSTLDGGAGADTLWGNDFADVLKGGLGDDILNGGLSADRYVFDAPGWGADQIVGFSSVQGDKIDLRGLGLSGIGDLAIVSAANTQITLGASSIYLFGVTSVSASDFIFS